MKMNRKIQFMFIKNKIKILFILIYIISFFQIFFLKTYNEVKYPNHSTKKKQILEEYNN